MGEYFSYAELYVAQNGDCKSLYHEIKITMSKKKFIKQLQSEVDASFLYHKLYENNKDELASKIFLKMSQIEKRHADKVLNKIRAIDPNFQMIPPSMRARIQVKIANYFGYDFILSHLAQVEYQMSKSAIEKKHETGEKITGLENVHLNIIQSISQKDNLGIGGSLLTKFEGKHKSVGGNELRAAVLGANDGLVSNLSLVMGVSGAAALHSQILTAGIAGLIAGAISMALGEWLSVQSSRELYQRQVEIEAEELENSPEEEMNELALLYQAKGIAEQDALKIARDIISNKDTALDALVREELGIDKDVLGGSAWKAAFTSFFLFSLGAIIPLSAFFIFHDEKATFYSLIFSTVGLFGIGASITLYTGRNVWYSGLRQIIFGLTAAGITYMIGKWISISIL